MHLPCIDIRPPPPSNFEEPLPCFQLLWETLDNKQKCFLYSVDYLNEMLRALYALIFSITMDWFSKRFSLKVTKVLCFYIRLTEKLENGFT